MILEESELERLRLQFSDKKLVLTGGTFDVLHRGHVDCLERRSTYGDILVVSIASDAEINSRKGPDRPIHNQIDRAYVIDALKIVDYTIVRTGNRLGESMARIIRQLLPDRVVVGKDMAEENPEEFATMQTAAAGIEIIEVEPSALGSSSSRIIERLG